MNRDNIFIASQFITMATDVICGMKVKESTDLKSEFQGKTFYFCSSHCKADFDKNPFKYSR
jgi:YHS domain-containing protein